MVLYEEVAVSCFVASAKREDGAVLKQVRNVLGAKIRNVTILSNPFMLIHARYLQI